MLDHLCVVDADPVHLVSLAAANGFAGIGLFQTALPVLPLMPVFDCVADRPLRRRVRQALADTGVRIDLVYPFTLTGRSQAADFAPALDSAADLGAGAVNVLAYDRDPARRADVFAAFCDLALARGLKVALEFYPPSRVPTLADAIDLAEAVARPGQVGVNVDLLHLMRSGGSPADLAAAPHEAVLFAQVADGMLVAPPDPEVEAGARRLLPGEGQFNCAGYVRAVPRGCPLSIEAPRDADVGRMTIEQRAAQAAAALGSVLAA